MAAHMELPLRSVQVLVSEMVAEDVLEASEPADTVDISLLTHFRDRIQSL